MNLTYKDWRAKGYQVMKGQKHVARSKEGECLFSEEQVDVMQIFRSHGYRQTNDDEGWDYEGSVEEYMSFGDTQDAGFW